MDHPHQSNDAPSYEDLFMLIASERKARVKAEDDVARLEEEKKAILVVAEQAIVKVFDSLRIDSSLSLPDDRLGQDGWHTLNADPQTKRLRTLVLTTYLTLGLHDTLKKD
jgi:hypothetical protein